MSSRDATFPCFVSDRDFDNVVRKGNSMTPRTKTALRAPAGKVLRRQLEPDAEIGLRTGFEAPSEVSVQPLEASIGFEVRRDCASRLI
jgi:hypothetical protein